MLDTQFPRPIGDIGNPASWPVPTLLRTVPRLAPDVVVQSAAGLRAAGLLPQLAEALQALQAAGCTAITTSCGFLVLLQAELQAALRVPLASSSLLQLPGLLQSRQRVGVLTISARHLGAEHLLAAGVAREHMADVVVQGVEPGTEFVRCILGNQPRMDVGQAEEDVVAAAQALVRRAPDVRTVVLECTNMPPYAARIRRDCGVQVRSLFDAAELGIALH